MSQTPLYSILVANYNNSKFFQDLLDSINNQTYKNLEILFCDDCSNDNSLELLKEFAKQDTRIKVLVNPENKGVAFTKDRLIRGCKGEYFGFVDPDDYLEANAVETMVKLHLQNPEFGLIYSNFYMTDEAKTKIVKYENPKDVEQSKFLLYGFSPNHFSSFKKEFYNKTEGINLSIKRAIDRDLVLKYEEVAPTKHIEDYLYYYRINTNSISNNANSFKAEYWAWICRLAALKRRCISEEDFYSEYKYYFASKTCDFSQTKDYKLGNLLLKPFRFVLHLFK